MPSHQLLPARTLDLFAGAGGGILGGILLGWQSICAIEIDLHCQKVLSQRQKEGTIPWFPIYNDVCTFDGKPWRGLVDIVTGGFPCQGYSTAGRRKGKEDKRNLWPDTIRILREVAPPIAFLENVPGLLSFDYFGEILGDLAESGFDAEWDVVSAASVGAPHIRERLWILAYRKSEPRWNISENPSDGIRRGMRNVPGQDGTHWDSNCGTTEKKWQIYERTNSESSGIGIDGNANGKRQQSMRKDAKQNKGENCLQGRNREIAETIERRKVCLARISEADLIGKWWETEPGLGRVANGVADRLERLQAIGNGQVPRVAAIAFLELAQRAGIL